MDGKDMVRFGLSALNANEYDGRVNVNNWNPDNANDNVGVRSAVGWFSSLLRRKAECFKNSLNKRHPTT
jgi:hypothetical protein